MTDTWSKNTEDLEIEVVYRNGDPIVSMYVDALDDLATFEAEDARSLGEFFVRCADKMERKS